MRSLFIFLFVLLLAFNAFTADAYAKRFGGGRSFGVTRSINSNSYLNNRAATAERAAQRPLQQRSWFAPMLGLLAGGLLASLFFQNGFGSALLMWLAVGAVIYLLISLLRQRQASPLASSQYSMYQQRSQQQQGYAGRDAHVVVSSLHGFDEIAFIRDAKALFIRLQTAYDQKNLADLRQFTTPQVFAEIQLQLQERGDASNVTEVLSLDAVVLDLNEEANVIMASVRFNASIREEIGAHPIAVTEIWHFQKRLPQPDWVVAGIQQD
jgi:predicted lipid-binding transport protein (Tim44 family)